MTKTVIHIESLVDLEKSQEGSIWTQQSALIQPRTSTTTFLIFFFSFFLIHTIFKEVAALDLVPLDSSPAFARPLGLQDLIGLVLDCIDASDIEQ